MTVERVQLSGAMHAVITGMEELSSPGLSGPARSRIEGDTFVVVPDECGEITLVRSSGGAKLDVRVGAGGAPPPVHVRVPRGLAIDADMTAGTIEAAALSGPLRIRLGGGSIRLDACDGPVDVGVSAGSVVAALRVTERSRVRCDAGIVRVTLLGGSDVTARFVGHPARHVVVAGAGRAPLDVEVGVGTAEVDTAM